MKLFDTIAAIATPYGKGGVAIIRISGEDAISVADKVFASAKGIPVCDFESSRLYYGEIYRNTPNGERLCIDDGMAVVFRAPHSFTGENTVEINCHGGILVTRCVLSAVLEAGARMAGAGEFTRRAFVNGKMKLTQAEALGYLLDAENENQLMLSRGGMRGILSDKSCELYRALVDVLGSIYAKIDFPDEDLNEMSREQMRDELLRVRGNVMELAATYRTGKAVSEGIRTAICGHTNVGKSSIYNRIIGRDAAIVTDIEGTTRDILSESATLGGVTLRLSDTAGIRATDDVVESIGIERARAEIRECELILAVFDAGESVSDEDREFYAQLSRSGKRIVALYNKSDLGVAHSSDEDIFDKKVYISAKTGEGFDELSSVIGEMFIDGSISLYADAVVMDERQYSALSAAAESLGRAVEAIDGGLALDLCCIDVEAAMSDLGELDGREIGEDVVGNIFSRFCVGK